MARACPGEEEISTEPSGNTWTALLNSAMNSAHANWCAVGLSILPVLSEVSFMVGSSWREGIWTVRESQIEGG
jgi:hypothetical protein